MRPDKDTYFLRMAKLVATRTTCCRRAVGCVLVDRKGHVLATGYNGVAAGQAHCLDVPCSAATAPSGTNLDGCEAIHAEQNALLQCKDVHAIHTVYCTTEPCITCAKLLANTSAERVVFLEWYHGTQAKDLWLKTRGPGTWIEIKEI